MTRAVRSSNVGSHTASYVIGPRCPVRVIFDRFSRFCLTVHVRLPHGRYICKATKPACDRCLIADLCKWPEKTADKPPPGTVSA
jgi:hypothetical protein